MARSRWWAVPLGAVLGLAACGPPEPPHPPSLPDPAPLSTASASAAPAEDDAAQQAFLDMLERVSKTRGLGILGPVKWVTIDRPAVAQRIRAQSERELPPDVLTHETEALVALGLIDPSFDAEDGIFELIGASVTGFYEPLDKTMYLTVDVSEAERVETLAHELTHALQDQHYALGPMFKYHPDDDERIAAAHALAEGDATSVAFDVVRGDAMGVSENIFAAMARGSVAELAPDSPVVLRESLVAPYTDGFAFVQALRRRGGFEAVDAAWRAMPATTEQVLHLDKYDAKEPAIEVASPSLDALSREAKGKGSSGGEKRSYKQVYTQTIGEQSMRIVLDAWTSHDKAVSAAAGWGGDRYVLAQGEGAATGETALVWHIVFDTETDAKEMAAVLKAQAHGSCVARPDLGPFAWARKKRSVVLAMGPYRRMDRKARSAGTCKEAEAWIASVLAAGSEGVHSP